MMNSVRQRPVRAVCLLENDDGLVRLLGDETITATPEEALRYFIPRIALAATDAFQTRVTDGTGVTTDFRPSPDCTDGIAHEEHAVLDEDEGEFLVISPRFSETLERYKTQLTANRDKDDFYADMLRLALRKSNPDGDELRALLRLIQHDGGDPQATYEQLLQERNPALPEPPSYQNLTQSSITSTNESSLPPTPAESSDTSRALIESLQGWGKTLSGMLRACLAQPEPQLNEVRGYLKASQEEGVDPEAAYKAELWLRSGRYPAAPDCQTVAPDD